MATKKPVSTDKPLTLRQRRFVQALPLASSHADAARIAGYSDVGESAKSRATETLSKRNVQAALQAALAAMERASIAPVIERKEVLTATVRGELPSAKVPEITLDHRLKAVAELNRMEGIGLPQNVVAPVVLIKVVYETRPTGVTVEGEARDVS